MPKIFFSVAVPTYNFAQLLPETLDSILGQSLPADEVVVVDDGSTDSTSDVLARYGGRILGHRIVNSGNAAARRAAADLCQGTWIAFCDHDDLWLPNHLESLRRVIDQVPDARFVFSDFKTFGTHAQGEESHFDRAPAGWWRKTTEGENIRTINADGYKHFLDFNPVFTSCLAIRRDFYDRIGGINPAYSRMCSDDADLTRRAVLFGKLACINLTTVRIRKFADNMSSSIAKWKYDRAIILRDQLQAGIVPQEYISATQRSIAESFLDSFRHAYWANDADLLKRSYKAADRRDLTLRDRLRYYYGRFLNRGHVRMASRKSPG